MKILSFKFLAIALVSIITGVLIGIFLLIRDYPISYWSVRATTFLPHEKLGFVRRTDYSYREKNSGGQELIDYRINNIGLRGKEIPAVKQKPRILLLGSSIVFGQGVEEKYTIAEQLSNKLKTDHKNIDVINAGLVAYSLDQKYKILQTSLIEKIKPDQIIFFISTIDFVSLRKNAFILNLFDYNAANDTLSERDVTKSLFYLTSKWAQSLNNYLDWPNFIGLVHTVINKLNNSFELKKLLPVENERVYKILSEIRKLAENNKIKALFVILPDKTHVGAEQYMTLGSRLNLFDLNQSKNLLQKWDSLFLEDEYHLSAAGHAAVTEELYPLLSAGFDR